MSITVHDSDLSRAALSAVRACSSLSRLSSTSFAICALSSASSAETRASTERWKKTDFSCISTCASSSAFLLCSVSSPCFSFSLKASSCSATNLSSSVSRSERAWSISACSPDTRFCRSSATALARYSAASGSDSMSGK